MKKCLRVFYLLIFLLGHNVQSNSQEFLSTQGTAIINESGDTILLRGMGLGGWMLQEGYMLHTTAFAGAQYQIKNKIKELIGQDGMEAFYDAWLNNFVQKEDIDSLKSWGFNSVRLPMHYNLYTLPIEDEPIPGENTWIEKGFELTDSLISWCRANDMYVILDLHAAPGGQGMDQGISDYDPAKPSLWQSLENKNKTIALWSMLAERYSNEPVIAGYDLLNEVNWNLPNNTSLRSLYMQITDAIRQVDSNHIIFIEGNWFANDFTGLTPPWDDKLVYSPHKYWSFNNQASIQWVLDIREDWNVPLYLGESGENSNVWFRDAIHLLEEHGIGWAWWPMKKVQDIAGPLSINKSPEYQSLLSYWTNGGNKPDKNFALTTLLELASDAKIENCRYQKDVIDAMIRQQHSEETIPFNANNIPGIIYASDYDLGPAGIAYFDSDNANYHVSTGSYTAWNKGWSYRNDGVDIESSSNLVNGNGYNVGWIEKGEWMQYTIDVNETATYAANIRVATAGTSGVFHFKSSESQVSGLKYVPQTGGFQNWQTISIPDIILTQEDKYLKLVSNGEGFNVASIEFVKTCDSDEIETKFVYASSKGNNVVQLDINKPVSTGINFNNSDFTIHINNQSFTPEDVYVEDNAPRTIQIKSPEDMIHGQDIKISYSGNEIISFDGIELSTFIQRTVENLIPKLHALPGRIEAEDYFFQSGIAEENTFDTGGGKNIGHLDIGDYTDYLISVNTTGIYNISFRTAAPSETGEIQLQLIEENGDIDHLETVQFNPTGDWQSWATTNKTAKIPAGKHTLRFFISKPQFNLNWVDFDIITSTKEIQKSLDFNLYPNPASEDVTLHINEYVSESLSIDIYDQLGIKVKNREIPDLTSGSITLSLEGLENGLYFVRIKKGKQETIQNLLILK